MAWTPEKQKISFGKHAFVHEGCIGTHPSHDLSHLLLAANGKLLWSPEGEGASIKVAEYNAVFLEHLLNNSYDSVVLRRGGDDDDEVFTQTLSHARWFIELSFLA